MAPYCSLRLIALVTAQDLGSAAHLRGHLATVHTAGAVIDGLWSGLRAFWVFVIVAPVLLASRGRLVQAGLLVLLVAATAAANVSIATDLSRAASTVVPAAVLGIILLVAGATEAGVVAACGGSGVQSAGPGAACGRGVERRDPHSTVACRARAA